MSGLVHIEAEVITGPLADARQVLAEDPDEVFSAAELVLTAADPARIEALPLDGRSYLHAVDRLTDEVFWLARDPEDGTVFGRVDPGATRHYRTAMAA